MMQDLMTIVYGFSSRLCGLRNYRRQLRAALASNHAAGAPDQN
jgi:predicted site-specific integrase-resolvase